MNARILKLIKNPELIQKQDLNTLNAEIKNTPYSQSIRALYLYGIYKLKPDNYREELSETAAYTTDKKILYQLINKSKIEQETEKVSRQEIEIKPEILAERAAEPTIAQEDNAFTNGPVIEKPVFEPVYVDGELNRILFKGEEDFLNQPAPAIDIEQTKETGVIITQAPAISELKKEDNSHIETEIPSDNAAEIKPEIIKEEAEISPVSEPELQPVVEIEENVAQTDSSTADKEEIKEENFEDLTKEIPAIDEVSSEIKKEEETSAAVNFHGTAEFLPEVKLSAKPSVQEIYEVPKTTVNKHELEMQRLIAEVEKKMKNRKRTENAEAEEILPNASLDFSETMEMGNSSAAQEIKNPDFAGDDAVGISSQNIGVDKEDSTVENPSNPDWKPMTFGATASQTFSRKNTFSQEKLPVTEEQEAVNSEEEVNGGEVEDEKPAFNISFFTQNVTSIETEKAAELITDLKEHIEPEKEVSNVPVFINTWQNWLKIDRSAQQSAEELAAAKAEEKNKVIETFITKEPKISKLREETDFVVKERGDNISHLMTETLAKLYAEQKLYTKAMKAYEVLTEKYPERSEYFAEQIQQIKDLRLNK